MKKQIKDKKNRIRDLSEISRWEGGGGEGALGILNLGSEMR